MTAVSAARLYSPQVLSLATRLAHYPMRDDLPLHGSVRSPVCGSAIEMGIAINPDGTIHRLGLRVQACAIGQASAALFADYADGQSRASIASALQELEVWLGRSSSAPAWPGLEAIAPARDYPGRHGAILLAWKAALEALPTP